MVDLLRTGRRGEQAAEFWRRLQQGGIAFQRCVDCGAVRFPPGPGCPSCGSAVTEWTEPHTQPVVVCWTVTRGGAKSRLPKRFASEVPYILTLVRFPDVAGVLLPALLLENSDDGLRSGAPVALAGGDSEYPRLTARLVRA